MTANEDAARLHQLVGLAFVPAVKAINDAMDELGMTYSASNPVQGEASHKVLAYRVAVATVETLLAARASIGPDSERIREVERVIASAMAVAIHGDESYAEYMVNAADIVADRLRAAGLLPGPDSIVVSREALEHVSRFVWYHEPNPCGHCQVIRAALSRLKPEETP